MRIARFSHQDAIRFGIVDEGELVVLDGDPMFAGFETTGERVPLADVALLAPVIPRSKIVCVGPQLPRPRGRARQRRADGADAVPQAEHLGDRPRRRDRAAAAVRAHRLRGRARRRHRPHREERRSRERPRLRLRLHDRQRRHRARPAEDRRAVGAGEGLRHVLPARARDRDGVRPDRRRRHHDASQRRGAPAGARSAT